MTRSFEEMTIALKELEEEGKISKVTASFLNRRISIVLLMKWNYFKHLGEDRALRILTQSDPYVSRFIWEVRSTLDRGWYLPVFKGVDPVGKVLMFKVTVT